jgi:hypothetical protein
MTAEMALLNALILACSMVSQYRTQRARVSAPHTLDDGLVDFLQFENQKIEILYDPTCDVETHCRSACHIFLQKKQTLMNKTL